VVLLAVLIAFAAREEEVFPPIGQSPVALMPLVRLSDIGLGTEMLNVGLALLVALALAVAALPMLHFPERCAYVVITPVRGKIFRGRFPLRRDPLDLLLGVRYLLRFKSGRDLLGSVDL
jgi:hypothetical protein